MPSAGFAFAALFEDQLSAYIHAHRTHATILGAMSASQDVPHWKNVVEFWEAQYPHTPRRPETQNLINALKRAAKTATTLTVPGNGNCLVSSINATLSGEVVGRDLSKVIVEGWAKDQDPFVLKFILEENGKTEMSPNDLLDDKKNDLNINWVAAISNAYNLPITVLVAREGALSVYSCDSPDPMHTRSYLLLHNGHFWPLKGEIDPSKWSALAGAFADA